MDALPDELTKDVEDIANLSIVPTMLNVLCQTTGMGFAAVARVTDDEWITCSVNDLIGFGLRAGDRLDVTTTLCNELKVTGQPLVIGNIDTDPHYHGHKTPALYGFKSYISVPIFRKDGRYFGSMFAIDSTPKNLNAEATAGMLSLFGQLVALNLSTNEQIRLNEIQFNKDRAFINALELKAQERTKELQENNDALVRSNKELEAFAYISSHDLQEPLRKIQTLVSILDQKEMGGVSERGRDYFTRIKNAAARMQALIDDLLSYSKAGMGQRSFKETDMAETVAQVKEDLHEELQKHLAAIEVQNMCRANIIPYQFRQLLQNLISNSLKFARPGVNPHITINCETVSTAPPDAAQANPGRLYHHISIADNGIGFDQQYAQKIFTLFQRLHDRSSYSGTGIGLAIVKRIVDSHQGFISASGKPGEGAVFNIYLPQTQVQDS